MFLEDDYAGSRDNLVENIPTTPSTKVEDDKFALRDRDAWKMFPWP